MQTTSPGNAARAVPFTALVPFLVIAFALTWGILGLFIFLPAAMTGLFGELTGHHPLFYLAVYAPAIAALVLVVRHGGLRGLGAFLSRLLLWRCPPGWYLFLLAGIPLLFVAGAALKGSLSADAFALPAPGPLAVALLLMAIKGPVEELGWRGLALPLLQRRMAPIWAGLVLGVIWGLWHLPAFLLSGTPQSGWSFAPFFVGSVAISVMLTPLFNASRGSLLLPALFHLQLINPLWPDGQPHDTLFFVAAAVVVVWVQRATLFTREGAVTTVIPAGAAGAGVSRTRT